METICLAGVVQNMMHYPRMAKTASLQDRIRLAKAMNDMLMQDYAMIPLIHRGGVSAHSNTISGVRMNEWDSELWNIADWKRN